MGVINYYFLSFISYGCHFGGEAVSSRYPSKYVIGLTGNIAVGKSVVRQMLQHLGAYTVDADSMAHQTMSPGAPAYKPVIETFGKMIIGSDGRINRMALGNIVFSNPVALEKLESITHPIIRKAIDTLIKRSKQRVVVIEAIKLLEGDLKDACDTVWVVNSTKQTQYRRLLSKRKMSEADAKQRILSQNKQADKVKQATVVIQNDSNIEDTWKQVQYQWSEIRKSLTVSPTPSATPPAKSAKAAPSKATPAKATPAKAKPAPIDAPAPTVTSADGIEVKRGMPNNAQLIADFITKLSDKEVSRMDVMMSFGQKSYLLAQRDKESIAGLMGWTVENLVTRMDEFYIEPSAPVTATIQMVIQAIEDASKELQSEVAFVFLAGSTPDAQVKAFQGGGYEPTILREIKIPAWREAVDETVAGRDMVVLWKQLRKDRVLQPI
jgi:dephospho-CoA kinase